MINIGKENAKKFVLQGIGRGIRIEPYKGERKRLAATDENKNQLLETLFVFATDKSAVKAIVEAVEKQHKNEVEISLFENEEKPFDLLLPVYKEEKAREKIAKFNISHESLENFKKYFSAFEKNTLLLKMGLSFRELDFITEKINNDKFFQIKKENVYFDMNLLLNRLIFHTNLKSKFVSGIKEIEDEIIHFKHIKVINFDNAKVENFKDKIAKVKNIEEIDKQQLALDFGQGKITEAEFNEKINPKKEESFNDIKIKKIYQHYYLPLMYSENEKQEYIKHIIDVPSEVKFVQNLERFISENKIENEWMFLKIDESLDKLHIPYFYKKENIYRKFFPDFIFWIKNGDDYKIIFVDPKGTNYAEYQNKIDEFERLFLEKNGKQKKFEYKNFKISFDLKMIANDINKVAEKYEKYWLGENDYSFI